MEEVLVGKENITEYIPQQYPMVMIDALTRCENETTKTIFEVRGDNIFVEDGYLNESGIIENIAQTAAVKAGYEVKKHGREPLLGFIGAIKDLNIFALPAVGDLIETTVVIKMEVMGVTVIEGSSACNGKKIAGCEMKIFIQKTEEQNG